MFTLIIRNNATSEISIYDELNNVSESRLYLQFDDLDLDVADGEYTYVVFHNDRPEDLIYDLENELLETKITFNDLTFQLKDLNPVVGLLRVGMVEPLNIYNKDEKTYQYAPQEKDEDENNETLYYEG